MKKFTTIIESAKSINDVDFLAMLSKDASFDGYMNVSDVDTLREQRKMHDIISVLAFDEIRSAIACKTSTLVFDCNFAQSRFHNKKDASENEWKVDYSAIVSSDDVNTRMIQIYARKVSGDTMFFDLYTSCKHSIVDASLLENVGYTTERDRNGRPTTSKMLHVPFENVPTIIKQTRAILKKDASASKGE